MITNEYKETSRSLLAIGIITALATIIIAGIFGIGLSIDYKSDELKLEANIEYSDDKIDAKITVEDEGGQGSHEDVVEDIPTVEEIDDPTPSVDINAGEGISRV